MRAVILASDRRRIAFTPDVTGDVRIELEDSGADTNRNLKVSAANVGAVADGRIVIACTAQKRVMIDVDLERAFEGTVRVKANAV